MGRMVDVDDLVTAGVIVVRMGLTRIQRVHELMRLHSPMPGPVHVGPRILLWHWPDVSAWAAAHDRPAIDPDDWVAKTTVAQRLGLEQDDLQKLPSTAKRDVDGHVQYRWRDAESYWIERTNRPRN